MVNPNKMLPHQEEEGQLKKYDPEAAQSRLGVCFICKTTSAKYTCPACQCVTCSLPCSKKHKVDNDCDGIRIRTSFVKLDEFNNLHLLSDYRLLDDIALKVDACHRDKLNKNPNPNHPRHFQNKSSKLKHAVLTRGSDLIILPNQFLRHKNNTSFFDTKTKVIKWKIQYIFLNASQLTINNDRCSEETILKNLIENVLLQAEGNLTTVKKLEPYRSVGLDRITVLMKTERVPGSEKKFYKLDLDKNLRENFIGKTIMEYPQFFVLIEGCYTSKTLPNHTAIEHVSGSGNNWLLSQTELEPKPVEVNKSHGRYGDVSKILEVSSDDEEPDEIDMEFEVQDKLLPSYKELIVQRQRQF